MTIVAVTYAPAQARDQDPALRERVNRIGSDLFSPTPHPAEAIKEELRQALALNPELTQARMILARIYLDLARASRARDELQVALEKVPNNPQL